MRASLPGLVVLVWVPVFAAVPQISPRNVSSINVNTRYDVESVEITGSGDFALSSRLQGDIQKLVGEKLDLQSLDNLARRIRKELRAKTVTHRLLKGEQPDHVRIVYEVTRRSVEFDVSVPRFLYHSRQGWTAQVEGSVATAGHKWTAGIVSDHDELVERNSGLYARYESPSTAAGRLQFRFQAESYRQQWNRETQDAFPSGPPGAGVPGLYRTRLNLQPTLAIVLFPGATMEAGFSAGRVETQVPAARLESAHAVINTLRYHRQWEGSGKQVLDAGYSLRAAAKPFASDFAYTRHRWNASYGYQRDQHQVRVAFLGGTIAGDAPLFERFILGNSNTLRGWNRFDIAPLGGNRMAHGSVEYRYRVVEVFYDTGAVWSRGRDPEPRNSLGVGLRKGAFSLAVAFPLRDYRMEPMILAGMNF